MSGLRRAKHREVKVLGCSELSHPKLHCTPHLPILNCLAHEAPERVLDRTKIRRCVIEVGAQVACKIEPELRTEVAVRRALPLVPRHCLHSRVDHPTT